MERTIWKLKKIYKIIIIINLKYMQYKIPVQIENEDPIVLWLSLRQLTIIIIWWWIWYSIFKSLSTSVWPEIASVPSITVAWIAFAIAKFRIAEMTFLQFIFSFVRQKVNFEERVWQKWVDSFQLIDVWYIINNEWKNEEKIDFKSKMDKINEIEDKIDKI